VIPLDIVSVPFSSNPYIAYCVCFISLTTFLYSILLPDYHLQQGDFGIKNYFDLSDITIGMAIDV
jgi:hypothetical protein